MRAMNPNISSEFAALLLVSRSVCTSLQLSSMLKLVVDQVHSAMGLSECGILLLDGDRLTFQAYCGPIAQEQVLRAQLSLANAPILRDILEARDLLVINDLNETSPLTASLKNLVLNGLMLEQKWNARSIMILPMTVRENLIGVMSCLHAEPGFFKTDDPTQIGLLHAFASQAALACNNVQLSQRTQALALIEERARLARELHDSVSQALYGLQLGVRTARAHLPANPDKAALAMDYVLPLSEGALSEMRALIFELRPESLEKEGLALVLQKMAKAYQLRNQITVSVDTSGYDDTRVNPEQKFALQRIAQESLHNMAKHAQCKQASVCLKTHPREVTLNVDDEGRGFDPKGNFPGHYGLTGMRERAEAMFGTLEISSAAGKGTHIFARLPIY